MRMKKDEALDRLARGRDAWFQSDKERLPSWMDGAGLTLYSSSMVGVHVVNETVMSETWCIGESAWRQRRIELGLDKRPEPDVTPKEEAWNEKRMDAIGQNGGEGLHYEALGAYKLGGPGTKHLRTPCSLKEDTGAHYRHSFRAKVTQADADRGYVDVKLDPYRICDIYQTGGGPREHIVKKGLRGLRKGDTERGLIKQLRDALDRWEEMLDEDEGK